MPPKQRALARTGRNPRIDTNTGSSEPPRYCSRLVCTEVRHEGSSRSFIACQEDIPLVEDPFLISTADVSRAHILRGRSTRCVRLPDEDPKAKEPGTCGKLRTPSTDLWTRLNSELNIMHGSQRREAFLQARHFRATSPRKELTNQRRGAR